MKTSERGIELIKAHEGLRLTSYPDPASGGEPWTCGYGCTHGVHPGMKITLEEAEQMLKDAIVAYEDAVTAAVKVPISQNAFDALVSWTYNVGIHAMQGSTLIKRLNAGDRHGAADALLMWDKASHHVMAGLHKRREDERALFLKA
jgi:lysozyme